MRSRGYRPIKKQIITMFLVMFKITLILPATASATANSGTCGQSATWSFDRNTGTLSISGTGEMYNFRGALLIDLQTQKSSGPAPWDGFSSEIKSVVIAAGITSIGNYFRLQKSGTCYYSKWVSQSFTNGHSKIAVTNMITRINGLG